jgi:DNA-binding transcriptional MerR regulator/methylmalonyl-CoA mutase cobalamin-binding subunit
LSKSNNTKISAETHAGISAVERDTGISKDTLRIWERRYGFPTPLRDANGERVYAHSQVTRLRLIKRLLDAGHRPGKIVAHDVGELEQLARKNAPVAGEEAAGHAEFMATLKSHDAERMQHCLTQSLMRQGLERFVTETVTALNIRVGEAWSRGELAIHEEHLYAQQIENTLRHAIFLASHRGGPPRVLLTSMPGEQHRIGLLMAEALFTAGGAFCIALGAQTPVSDIALAAVAHRADIVALSFSAVFQPGPAQQSLRDLRAMLPATVSIWAGGSGLQRVGVVPGVEMVRGFAQLQQALSAWRASHLLAVAS